MAASLMCGILNREWIRNPSAEVATHAGAERTRVAPDGFSGTKGIRAGASTLWPGVERINTISGMPRAPDPSRLRRVLMQSIMWIILGATIGLAALVDHKRYNAL